MAIIASYLYKLSFVDIDGFNPHKRDSVLGRPASPGKFFSLLYHRSLCCERTKDVLIFKLCVHQIFARDSLQLTCSFLRSDTLLLYSNI